MGDKFHGNLVKMESVAQSSHTFIITARHTFATWMLRHGAKIENVSCMLGHTNITQTQRYAKVLACSVQDEFDRMADIIINKKDSP